VEEESTVTVMAGLKEAFGFHLFDFTADTVEFPFNFKDVRQFSSAIAKQVGQPLFGVAGVGEPRLQIEVSQLGHPFCTSRSSYLFNVSRLVADLLRLQIT
jgi:hypothetical protein